GFFNLPIKFNVLASNFIVGIQLAKYASEGSFLIPGGRQRQTLSPLLTLPANRDFKFKRNPRFIT
ncbi:MAG: hypothetical protein RRA32_07860, partial [bacterium]|nr:hypothetical protein [bacterium]